MDINRTSESAFDDSRAIKAKVSELVRYASISRLKIHAACQEVGVSELDASFTPGMVLADRMVFILLSGDPIRITFKIHFDTKTAKKLAFGVFGGKSASDISIKLAFDYAKEYCNLVAGSVATLFEKIRVDLGISLPLCTRGFYEVFLDYTEREHPIIAYSDFWRLQANGNEVYCSALIEILDKNSLGDLVGFEIPEETSGDAEMDFL
ncbi:MAG TPA: hypothetical protein VJ001_12135 [Rhodocyclaceae bacterium]|nr:hypothetical protein [Rhodocyclaceae bacterium]